MSNVSLRFATDFFLDGCRNFNTRDTYRYCFNTFMDLVGEDRTLISITAVDIQRYINWLIQNERAEYTIYKRHKELKRFFNWSIEMGYLTDNPAKKIKIRQPDIPIDERETITISQIHKLIHYLEITRDVRILAMVRFLSDTGCRRGGIANLEIKDLDLESCTAIVLEKGDKRRTVFYCEKTRDALQAWLEIRPVVEHQHVFTGDKRTGYDPMQPASVSQVIRRRCKSADVGNYGTHTFRHRKGFTAFDAGSTSIVVGKLLGHTDNGLIAEKHYSDHSRPAVERIARMTFLSETEEEKPTEATSYKAKIFPFRKQS